MPGVHNYGCNGIYRNIPIDRTCCRLVTLCTHCDKFCGTVLPALPANPSYAILYGLWIPNAIYGYRYGLGFMQLIRMGVDMRSEIGESGSKKELFTLLRSKPPNDPNNDFHSPKRTETAYSSRFGNPSESLKIDGKLPFGALIHLAGWTLGGAMLVIAVSTIPRSGTQTLHISRGPIGIPIYIYIYIQG